MRIHVLKVHHKTPSNDKYENTHITKCIVLKEYYIDFRKLAKVVFTAGE